MKEYFITVERLAIIYETSYEKTPVVVLNDTIFFIKSCIKELNKEFSNSHINRLIKSGAISVNGKKVYEDDITIITNGDHFLLRVGKFKIYKLKQ